MALKFDGHQKDMNFWLHHVNLPTNANLIFIGERLLSVPRSCWGYIFGAEDFCKHYKFEFNR